MMEPAPNVQWKKAALRGAILLLVVAVVACRPAADTSDPPPEPEQASASEQAPGEAAPASAESDAPSQLAAEGPEAEERDDPPSAQSPEETVPASAGRDDPQQAPDVPASATEPWPRPADSEALDEDPFAGGQPRDDPLPAPLVDDPNSLEPLQPNRAIWIAKDRSCVVMVGRVCQRRAPLELFACLRGSKEHESVVAVDVPAFVVYAGLTAAYAEPGAPVQFVPEFKPPTGTEIEVTVVWEEPSGRRRQARAQDWIRDAAGLYDGFEGIAANEFDEELNIPDRPDAYRDMQHPWVFAGSRFLVDEQTGERSYLADTEGDLICVSNFPSAVLDVPIRSSDSNAALLFEAFTERIPPIGTPVTLILTPKIEKRED
jgi:hypothetical protein